MSHNGIPRAVLFDVGMTLIHPIGRVMVEELAAVGVNSVSPERAASAWAAAAESHHIDFPRGATRSDKAGATWATLLGVRRDAGRAAWIAAAARPDLFTELDQHAIQVLRYLRACDIRVAAVSNSNGTLDEELTAFGLAEYFDITIDSTIVGTEKPDRDIFTTALTQVGGDPTQMWFVGDGLINDMFGAAVAGVGRLVLYDRHRVYRTPLPVTVIHTLGELGSLIADALEGETPCVS
ncbi:HAD family hydrolase [Nocardia stercoris]|uniref:HAD family hydrolase n=1 Tax=Nocardia stercoris TaxID=2483361 RepID=A0A3M2KS31_9NOCA|nr:HAD-IA family hydrolase [Nocardia stercoris]RMI28452.1 HAD family hydrolase [Nocardia stercoris]